MRLPWDVAAFQIKEEKLLAKNKILPDSPGNESVNAVSADQGKKNAWKDFAKVVMPNLYKVVILKQVQDDSIS